MPTRLSEWRNAMARRGDGIYLRGRTLEGGGR
jgi:hypothetical protein